MILGNSVFTMERLMEHCQRIFGEIWVPADGTMSVAVPTLNGHIVNFGIYVAVTLLNMPIMLKNVLN